MVSTYKKTLVYYSSSDAAGGGATGAVFVGADFASATGAMVSFTSLSAGMMLTQVLSDFPFLNATTPSTFACMVKSFT
jgi:hypothetical protein